VKGMVKGERFNSISHLIGAVLASVGLVVLVVSARGRGDVERVVSCAVYGSSLVLLYVCSTLYHSFHGGAKAVFKKLDHVSIYLLIAGTYTPVALVTLSGAWGWSIFGVNWGLAAVGAVSEFLPFNRRRILSYVLYVVMGWLALVAVGPIARTMETAGIAWLLAGGVFYTGGIVVYGWKSLPRNHELWHVCVMAGSLCHFVAILRYLG
jgi:hemolysin III